MPTFDMIVLGCGGGPSEHNLSSYIFKLCNTSWSDGAIGLEAGSGIGALKQLLRRQPDLFGHLEVDQDAVTAAEVYSWVQCFLITHAHLDHVNGLILSAGSMGTSNRRIWGARRALEDLNTVFSNRLWPKLASWSEGDALPLLLSDLSSDGQYHTIFSNISVRRMPLSHGTNGESGTYESSAFFIRSDKASREFLFFGDVEPDSLAQAPHNLDVWRAAAPKVPQVLSSVFIECSWPSGRADNTLYGHLSPEHLVDELTAFAAEVASFRAGQPSEDDPQTQESTRAPKRRRRDPPSPDTLHGKLDGVNVYIIHCKDDLHGTYDRPINEVIADQIRTLIAPKELGVEIIAVEQGMQISI